MTITCFKSRHFSTFPVFFQRISAHSKKYKLFSYPPATDYFVFANFAGTQTSRQAAFILHSRYMVLYIRYKAVTVYEAPVVQWIEWKIPVLQIRVRFPTGVQKYPAKRTRRPFCYSARLYKCKYCPYAKQVTRCNVNTAVQSTPPMRQKYPSL